MGRASRVLFITATRIGDAVMSTGVLAELLRRHPDAGFTIACGPLAAPLFAAVPRLERVIVIRKRPLDLHWLGLWRALRPIRWDVVVDLRRSLIAYTLRADRRFVLGPADPARHRVATLPSVIGIGDPLAPTVFLAPSHRAAAARLVPDGPPVLALGPVASLPEKTWPWQRFQALVRLLTAADGPCAGWRVAAFGGPGDEDVARRVLDVVAPADRIGIVGEPDLLTVEAALARCAAFVGNDSGLSHMAAAAGIPTVAAFGATDPVRYAPWGGIGVQGPEKTLESLLPEAVAAALVGLLTERARHPSEGARRG